jgi:catechol 2,3-dioxygenase-like lactoylglutathione lyase family enzyme
MKRLHVHVGVHDLDQSIRFYSALFASEPSVKKELVEIGKLGRESPVS